MVFVLASAFWIGTARLLRETPLAGVRDDSLLSSGEGPPREFAYVDVPRVRTYLGQIERPAGDTSTPPASATDTQDAAGDALRLADALDDTDELARLPEIKSTGRLNVPFFDEWKDVQPGDFVRLTATISIPEHVRLHHTATGLGPSSSLGRRMSAFLREAGRDAPLWIPIEVAADAAPPLRIVVEIRSTSIIELPRSNARVKILAHVDRILAADPYRAPSVYARMRSAMRRAPANLVDALGADPAAAREEVEQYAEVPAPAAVLDAIAIYGAG